MRFAIAAAVVALAGCPLGKSASTTVSMHASSGSAAPDTSARSTSSTSSARGASSASASGTPSAAGGGQGTIVMPDLIGKTEEEAIAIAKAAGFSHPPESSHILECVDAARDPGKINCQDPDAGKAVYRYQLIHINVYRPHVIANAIVRAQLATLHGMSPDDAKRQLKKLGHDGPVHVDECRDMGGGRTFIKECGINKVCYTSDESGIGMHDRITLFINPTLTIAPPPP